MSKNLENLKNDLTAIFIRYGRVNRDDLNLWNDYENWKFEAKQEMKRRESFLLQNILGNFQTEALAAIANGKLDIAQLAEEVKQALDNKEHAKAAL